MKIFLKSCHKLYHIIFILKVINSLSKDRITYLDILDVNKEINDIDFSEFKNLKKKWIFKIYEIIQFQN